MNKQELISAIADKTGQSKVKTTETIDSFIETVTELLANGDSLMLVGFGAFSTIKRAARTGRNPKTGKEIKIAAATLPKFKPGKALKESVSKPKPKQKKK